MVMAVDMGEGASSRAYNLYSPTGGNGITGTILSLLHPHHLHPRDAASDIFGAEVGERLVFLLQSLGIRGAEESDISVERVTMGKRGGRGRSGVSLSHYQRERVSVGRGSNEMAGRS
jgi:hypothetical protein